MKLLRFRVRVLALTFVALASCQIGYSQGFTLIGRIVDRNGDSIPSAEIVPRLYCPACPDLTIPAAVSNEEGYFRLSLDSVPRQLSFDIFGPTPEGAWNPFPQMEDLVRALRRKPIIIRTNRRSVVKLEKLHPTITFRPVLIDLPGMFGLSRESVIAASETVEIRIAFANGRLFRIIPVPAQLVKMNPSSLTFSIPNGEVWKIRISMRNGSASLSRDLVLPKLARRPSEPKMPGPKRNPKS